VVVVMDKKKYQGPLPLLLPLLPLLLPPLFQWW
jgi:hypothetical protein